MKPSLSSPAIAATLLCVVLLAACSREAAPPPSIEAPEPTLQGNVLRYPAGHPQLAMLVASEAHAGRRVTVEMPARLVWNEERTQRLYPAFGGRVASIRADVGQTVQPGTPLATLASGDFGQAQSDAARARADASLARQSLARQRELFDAGVVPRKDLEQAEAETARAQAELSRAESRTRLYGKGTAVDQQFTLASGVAGVVVERNLNPMQEVRADQAGTPLFVVTDPTSLWVQIDARESEARLFQPGLPFELVVPSLGGARFTGRVTAVADTLDPATRTLKVRGLIANPKRELKAEMLATARIERDLREEVTVPSGAVMLRGTKHQVFVRRDDTGFEPREVDVLQQGREESVLSAGVKPGERVVAQNALLLARQYRIAQDESKQPVDVPTADAGAPKAQP